MAWIYLADMEGSPSHLASGSDLSHTVKSSDTHKRCCCQELQMDNCLTRQSGTTLHRLMAPCYHRSISSTEASPAKILVSQEMERAWQESEAVFSSKCVAWSKKSSPLSSSWKTCQPLELEVFEKSSDPLQIWGMTVGGLVYLPKKLEPRTLGKDGSCWQSPVADDAVNRAKGKWNSRGEPKLSAQVLLPTPSASSYGTSNNGCPGDGRKEYRTKGKPSLETMARKNLWPTPTAMEGG